MPTVTVLTQICVARLSGRADGAVARRRSRRQGVVDHGLNRCRTATAAGGAGSACPPGQGGLSSGWPIYTGRSLCAPSVVPSTISHHPLQETP